MKGRKPGCEKGKEWEEAAGVWEKREEDAYEATGKEVRKEKKRGGEKSV